MTQQSNYIVYLAFGIRRVLLEVCYSIASLSKFIDEKSGVQIYIFTDDEKFLSTLLPGWINYFPLIPELQKTWKGKDDYVFRIKTEMSLLFSSNHQGNILYCDDDTVFLKSPLPLFEQIESGRVIAHLSEGHIHNQDHPLFIKISKFLRNYNYPGEHVPFDMEMWNVGIMGFNSDKRFLFEQSLTMIDDMYHKYRKHIMEQVVMSYFFGKHSPLSCEDYIFHYWNFKEFAMVLEKFFNEHQGQSFDQWSKDIDNISPMSLITSKLEFEKLPNWKRQFKKMIGQDWKKNLPL